MTILCAREFGEACAFAQTADLAYEEAIARAPNGNAADQMKKRSAMGTRSLLNCLGCLSRWDEDYNENPDFAKHFPAESEIVYQTGLRRKVGESPDKSWLPRQETFIYSDMAPHSFFFREDWIDPVTRQAVFVMDHLHYCFTSPHSRGLNQDSIDALSPDDLRMKALNRECQVVWTTREAEARKAAGDLVRHIERQRRGMCGGIIYHPDYLQGIGKQAPYGSWQIHT